MVYLVSCQMPHINPEQIKGETAVLRGSMKRSGLFDWETYMVKKVDGKAVFYLSSVKEKILLKPGMHHLDVLPEFNRSDSFLGVGPFKAPWSLEFYAEAGKEYEFSGRVEDDNFVIWVQEKSSGKKVVEETTSNFRRSSVSYPVYIPVVR